MNMKRILSSVVLAAGLFVSISPDKALAAPRWFNCQPTQVFAITEHPTWPHQMQVACTTSIPGQPAAFSWIGIQTGGTAVPGGGRVFSAAEADVFYSTAMAAILSGKQFRVWATDANCPVADGSAPNCKLVTAFSLWTP